MKFIKTLFRFALLILVSFPSVATKIPPEILSHPVTAVSHDGNWIAFVEPLKRQLLLACEQLLLSENRVDELWLYDVKNHHSRLLVSPIEKCDRPKEVIVGIDKLSFSLNDKVLYFQTTAWQISDALHAVDLDGENLRYLQPSKDFFVIPSGDFAGDLAIAQWRPFIPYDHGGFSWYWAFTPDGKTELDPIGPDLSSFGHQDRRADEFL